MGTHVNSASITGNSATSPATLTIPSGTGIQAGDVIVVATNSKGVTSPTVTVQDSVNLTNYTHILQTLESSSLKRYLDTFVFQTAVAIADLSTITITSTGATQIGGAVDIFRGYTATIDQAAVGQTNVSSTSQPAPALGANATAGALAMTFIASGQVTMTAGAPFTAGSTDSTCNTANGFLLSAPGNSTEASTWTMGGAGVGATQTVSFLAAGVTFVPQRYVQAAPPHPAPWEQRQYISDPSLLAGAPAADPLLTAGGDTGDLWRRYNTAAYYDRREVPQQRPYISVPGQLATALLENELLGGADTARHQHAAAYYARWWMPQQRPYRSDPLLLTTAELENELLGGAQTPRTYATAATHYARWWMPQQPPRNADPLLIQTAELENELLGGADTARHQHAAAYTDRREVPQQRAYISDPSFYPAGAVTDPLTVAWGDGGPYWHLYNRAGDITDRRQYFTQRLYQSDPLLLTTALLENELLGGGETGKYYRVPATHVPRWWMPEQRAYVSDPLLLVPAVPLDPTTAAWASLWLAYNLAATHQDRRLYPQQRLYWPVPPPAPVLQDGTIAGTVTEGTTMVVTAGEGTTMIVTVTADATSAGTVTEGATTTATVTDQATITATVT